MITLELLEPCQNCTSLDPVKSSEFDTFCRGESEHHCTITCGNIDKCKRLLEYLSKEVKNNGN